MEPFAGHFPGGALRVRAGATRSQTDDPQFDALTSPGVNGSGLTPRPASSPDARSGTSASTTYATATSWSITRLSRMARSVRHLTEIAALLGERGVDLVVLKHGASIPPPRPGGSCSTSSGRWPFIPFELIVEGTREGLAWPRAPAVYVLAGRRP